MALDESNDMNILLGDTSFIDSNFEQQFDFAFNDYRYEENRTPCSSPASSASALQSPYSMQADQPRSPPVTAKDFTQFFEASNPVSQAFEADFSELTLTDNEQRELYQAAKCIQTAYRSYKGRKKMEEKDLHAQCGTRKDKEKNAAIIIQNYYRRFKEYAYFREMTHAAVGEYRETRFAPNFNLFSLSHSDSKQVSIILREQKVQTIADYWLWFRFIF